MYQEALTFFPQFPQKLQTIGFPTPGTTATDSTEAEANVVLLAFLAKIESFLSLKSEPLNYTALWDRVKDPALPSLDILLNRTYPTLISKEQTKNVRDPFYADCAAVNDDRVPFIDPVPKVRTLLCHSCQSGKQHSRTLLIRDHRMQARWAFGDSLPASELDVAIANKTIFQDFWETYVLPAGNNDTEYCSESIILYSSGVNIFYRNTYLE